MAQRTGLEPATPGVTGRYSNRLNYRCASVDFRPVSQEWWVMTGSNRRPSACKADALPAELITRCLRGAKFTQGAHLSQHPASSFSKKEEKRSHNPGACLWPSAPLSSHAYPLLADPHTQARCHLISLGAIEPCFGDVHALFLQHAKPAQQLRKRGWLQIKLQHTLF